MISAVRALCVSSAVMSVAFARQVSNTGVLLSPLPSQLGTVTGMDLPAAFKEEDKVKVGLWLGGSFRPSSVSCTEGGSRLKGAKHLSFLTAPADPQLSSCCEQPQWPFHCFQWNKDFSDASEVSRPTYVLPNFLFGSGIKRISGTGFEGETQGICNYSQEMLPLCKEDLLGFFCRIECGPSTFAYSLALLLIISSIHFISWYFQCKLCIIIS